jgi:hypothetical protein
LGTCQAITIGTVVDAPGASVPRTMTEPPLCPSMGRSVLPALGRRSPALASAHRLAIQSNHPPRVHIAFTAGSWPSTVSVAVPNVSSFFGTVL